MLQLMTDGKVIFKREQFVMCGKHKEKSVSVTNSETGEYWERYPQVLGNQLRLQRAVLAFPVNVKGVLPHLRMHYTIRVQRPNTFIGKWYNRLTGWL